MFIKILNNILEFRIVKNAYKLDLRKKKLRFIIYCSKDKPKKKIKIWYIYKKDFFTIKKGTKNDLIRIKAFTNLFNMKKSPIIYYHGLYSDINYCLSYLRVMDTTKYHLNYNHIPMNFIMNKNLVYSKEILEKFRGIEIKYKYLPLYNFNSIKELFFELLHEELIKIEMLVKMCPNYLKEEKELVNYVSCINKLLKFGVLIKCPISNSKNVYQYVIFCNKVLLNLSIYKLQIRPLAFRLKDKRSNINLYNVKYIYSENLKDYKIIITRINNTLGFIETDYKYLWLKVLRLKKIKKRRRKRKKKNNKLIKIYNSIDINILYFKYNNIKNYNIIDKFLNKIYYKIKLWIKERILW